MSMLKRIAAGIIAFTMIICMVGCKDTTWAAKIDGYEIKAGIYIYFSYMVYNDAMDKLSAQEVDTTNDDAVKKSTIENMTVKQWIQNETTERLTQFVAAEKKFDELDLSLTSDEKDEIKAYVDSSMENYGDTYKKNGISEQSVKEIITNSYKSKDIFKKYYGVDGLEGVTEDQLKKHYIENNARVKYINVALKDGAGNLLKGNEKEDMIEKAEDYLQRLKDGENMDTLISEYAAYSESVSEEAVAATGTDENGETTTKSSTTTKDETTTTTEVTAENTAESDSNEETATTDSDETESDETTTTTDPHANETIIAKVTTATETDESDSDSNEDTTTTTVTYTPSKKSNEAIFNDAVIGKPFIVEEDEACYVILKLDIEERMTDDDLWNDDQIDSVEYDMYYNDFDKMMKDWAAELKVEKNNAAYDRYDPFEYDFS